MLLLTCLLACIRSDISMDVPAACPSILPPQTFSIKFARIRPSSTLSAVGLVASRKKSYILLETHQRARYV